MFEIIKTDLAGRIGIMYTNHGKIQTPAFVPVIHPVKQTIPSKKLKKLVLMLLLQMHTLQKIIMVMKQLKRNS
ncbi:MAG: hypothetical protein JW390_60048 [Nitrosopumilus sp.]|nr:hypothetical protein [Candidatus Nitrosopumilus limneticus]